MLQPASFSISRLSSTNGNSRSSASIRPSVDLPAPRKPMSAIRRDRAGASSLRGGVAPRSSEAATRTRRSVASSRSESISRSISHSGERVVTSPRTSASEHCSARVTLRRMRIEAFPTPYSRLARCRSDTPVARASALRVRPRRALSALTRSPSAARNGSFRSSAVSIVAGAAISASAGEGARSFDKIFARP